MFTCKRCAAGCDVCVDESPCLSTYDWAFRIALLTITIICIVFVCVLAFNIYRYRKLKVIKVASPIFLIITLLGCAIMYCEVSERSDWLIFHVRKALIGWFFEFLNSDWLISFRRSPSSLYSTLPPVYWQNGPVISVSASPTQLCYSKPGGFHSPTGLNPLIKSNWQINSSYNGFCPFSW